MTLLNGLIIFCFRYIYWGKRGIEFVVINKNSIESEFLFK